VTKAGYILATNSTRWRSGAVSSESQQVPSTHHILLHEQLAVTTYYCPASGTLLAVDIHERGGRPVDDVLIAPDTLLEETTTSKTTTESVH
jgi:N-methylhydantoinase B